MSFRGAVGEPGTHLSARDYGKAERGRFGLRIVGSHVLKHGFRVPLCGPGMTGYVSASPATTYNAPAIPAAVSA